MRIFYSVTIEKEQNMGCCVMLMEGLIEQRKAISMAGSWNHVDCHCSTALLNTMFYMVCAVVEDGHAWCFV